MRVPEATFSYPYPHPAVATDVVVFTIRDGRLSILLIRRANPPYQGDWALPGGFLDIDEDLDTCAARELEEETGISGLYLEQLYTFGATHRDPRERRSDRHAGVQGRGVSGAGGAGADDLLGPRSRHVQPDPAPGEAPARP